MLQKLAGHLELARLQTIGEEVEAALPETAATATKLRADPPAEVKRPAPISRRGTGGRDVQVATNYVRLELEDGKVSWELNMKCGKQRI